MSTGNTNYGDGSLENNINGKNNSAFGVCSSKNLDVSWNTSVGAYANMSNISGISNVAIGTNSLLSNVSGNYNTAIGTAALLNTLNNSNTTIGSNAMENNILGNENVAIGVQSGYNTINSNKNIFLGSYAGFNHIDGSENIFLGFNSGLNEINSSKNTFLGAKSGVANANIQYENSTAIGYGCLIDSSNQIMLGTNSILTVIPGAGYLTNISTSYTEQSIVPKKYIDTYVSGGLQITNPCECATTQDISFNPPNIPVSIDDVSLNNGMRVLVKCQDSSNNVSSSNINNGIYVYYSTGFVRASDCDDGDNVKGQTCFIRNGTLNKSILFSQNDYNTLTNEAVVGYDTLNYTEFYKITFSIGNGLEVISNTLQIKPKITNASGNPFLTFVGINGGINDISYSLDSGTKDILVNSLRVGKGNSNLDQNTIFGFNSGSKITTGNKNTFMGYYSGRNNTTGQENSFYGRQSGDSNTTGSYNSFFGLESGLLNDVGGSNSFFGYGSGRNSKGIQNSFFGALAGKGSSSFTGNYNVCFGWAAGEVLSTGEHNVFIGRLAGTKNTSGSSNTFVGSQSGNNFTGSSNNNSFFGYNSGQAITSGNKNTFIGTSSGDNSNAVSQSTYLGFESGRKNYGNNCTFVGSGSGNTLNSSGDGYEMTGSNNTFLGMESGYYSNLPNQNTGGNNTFLGYHSGYEWEDGSYNSFIGTDAGRGTKGSYNCSLGSSSGINISTGSYNTLIGYGSDVINPNIVSYSTAIGYNSKVDTSHQIVLGTSSELIKIPGSFLCNNDASFNSNIDVANQINTNKINVGSGGIDCSSGTITIFDNTLSSSITELLLMRQEDNHNKISFVLNPNTSAYNPLTQENDNLFMFSNLLTTETSLVIAPWSTTTNGIRMTHNETMIGSGGNTTSPDHRLNTDTTKFRITSSNFQVDGKIKMIGENDYLEFPDGTQQVTAFTTESQKCYTILYTSSTSITLMENCIGFQCRLIGSGGQAGSNASTNPQPNGVYSSGGSGGGGGTVWSNGILPLLAGTVINLTMGAGIETEINLPGIGQIAKAGSGSSGGSASSGIPGTGGSGATTGSSFVNTSLGSWNIQAGVNGVGGIANASYLSPSGIPETAGYPLFQSFDDTTYGCGQRYNGSGIGINFPTTPTPYIGGCIYITYYFI